MKHIKTYKIFESGQVFDYDGKKSQIISYIQNIRRDEEPFMPVNLFYNLTI
jgi:hypothetical protein